MHFTETLVRAAAVCALAVAAPAFAQGVDQRIASVLGEPAPYAAAIRALQAGVAAHDAAAVAALVSYPISVRVAGKKTTVRDAAGFVRDYDRIVTPVIAAAITAQRYEALMVSAQGVMFGNGEAWINGVCADKACKTFVPKVVTIQAPPKP